LTLDIRSPIQIRNHVPGFDRIAILHIYLLNASVDGEVKWLLVHWCDPSNQVHGLNNLPTLDNVSRPSECHRSGQWGGCCFFIRGVVRGTAPQQQRYNHEHCEQNFWESVLVQGFSPFCGRWERDLTKNALPQKNARMAVLIRAKPSSQNDIQNAKSIA
jgi:hypothetical protein